MDAVPKQQSLLRRSAARRVRPLHTDESVSVAVGCRNFLVADAELLQVLFRWLERLRLRSNSRSDIRTLCGGRTAAPGPPLTICHAGTLRTPIVVSSGELVHQSRWVARLERPGELTNLRLRSRADGD